MEIPIRIDFHGGEPTEALQRFIRDQVDGLTHFYERLLACHVKVSVPGKHQRKGGLYHIGVRIALPNGREVNVATTPGKDKRHSDVLFAISDAFRRAKRQLQDEVRQMRSEVKVHESRPVGKVASFDRNTGYGFIEAPDGHEVYFHRNSIVAGRPLLLRKGMRVSFSEEIGEKGPQASSVTPLGKHALR